MPTRRWRLRLSIFEATFGVRRKRKCSVAEAEADVNDFLRAAHVLATIESRDAHIALEAFARYGKGTRHPAQLNLGDCFAYALAKSALGRPLFKGEDFSSTTRNPRLTGQSRWGR